MLPQVTLDKDRGGGVNYVIKVAACDTLWVDDQESTLDDDNDDCTEGDCANVHLDFPPESFWLSKEAEYDWFDRNAFLDRKDSTRGSSNLSHHVKPSTSNHNSQRFTVNPKSSKGSLIGFPKTQKANFVGSGRRVCKSANIRLFPVPERSASVGKSMIPFPEPGSPKVSCIGRVRSKRGKRRSKSGKRNEAAAPVEKSKTCRDKPPPSSEKSKGGGSTSATGPKKKKGGLYSKVMRIFRSKKVSKKSSRSGGRKVAELPEEKADGVELLRRSLSYSEAREPPTPSLGGLKRFASGRHSGSWAAEDFNVAVLGPADSDRRLCRSRR